MKLSDINYIRCVKIIGPKIDDVIRQYEVHCVGEKVALLVACNKKIVNGLTINELIETKKLYRGNYNGRKSNTIYNLENIKDCYVEDDLTIEFADGSKKTKANGNDYDYIEGYLYERLIEDEDCEDVK